jgi:hypothetical protein
MLKLLCSNLIFFSNLLLLTNQAALSQTSPINSSIPTRLQLIDTLPFCYMETKDGNILNLSNLCKPTPAQNVSTPEKRSWAKIYFGRRLSPEEKIRTLCKAARPEQMDLPLRQRCQNLS